MEWEGNGREEDVLGWWRFNLAPCLVYHKKNDKSLSQS